MSLLCSPECNSECAPGNKGLFLRNYQFKVCSSYFKAICQRSLDNKIRYFYLMCASTKGLLAYNYNEIYMDWNIESNCLSSLSKKLTN